MIDGEIHFFLTGDSEHLPPDSIYLKLKEKDGYLRNIYGPAIQAGRWDFSNYAMEQQLPYKPCISSIVEEEDEVHITFRVVDSKQFAKDIACVKALVGEDKKLVFSGTIKEMKQ